MTTAAGRPPNPWAEIAVPSADYRHRLDRPVLPRVVTLPPQPWLGSFTSGRVLWLLGGFGTGDDMAIDRPDCRPAVLEWVRHNLGGETPDAPNAWLDPFPTLAPFAGSRDTAWWARATRSLADALRADDIVDVNPLLSERLFVLEAHPYPATTNPGVRLPTARYSGWLLDEWLRSGRPVVIGRAQKHWEALAPRLGPAIRAGQAIPVRNVQAATISPGNLPQQSDFDLLVAAISAPD
jgi:hypothetical protein